MRRQAKQQEPLPGTEVHDHPMWTGGDSEHAPFHIQNFRKELANRLKPFDGRPNSFYVTDYCKDMYDASTHEQCWVDPMVLIAVVVATDISHVSQLRQPQEVVLNRITKNLIISIAEAR